MRPDDRPDRFEERLLCELRSHVAARPAPASPRGRPLAARRTRVALAGAGAAALAGGALAAAGGGPTPAAAAYSVVPRDDTVTVTIRSLRDAAGLERRLEAAGVPAEVDYLPAGRTCREPRFQPADGGPSSTQVSDDGAMRFEIDRAGLRAGRTLVVTTSGGGGVTGVSVAVAQGPVGPCEPVAAPPLPAGADPSHGGGRVRDELEAPAGGTAVPID
jgi:hypothetical protein